MGASVALPRGTIVRVDLSDGAIGGEQDGNQPYPPKLRPCVVVSASPLPSMRNPGIVSIVPLSKVPLTGPLYPVIAKSQANGLTFDSSILVDQLRAIDGTTRITGVGRSLSPADLASLDTALRLLLGL